MLKEPLKPSVATIDLPVSEVLTKVQAYLKEQDLSHETVQIDKSTYRVITQMPTFWQIFIKRSAPQTKWTFISQAFIQTKLEILAEYPSGFWMKLIWLTVILLVSLLFTTIIYNFIWTALIGIIMWICMAISVGHMSKVAILREKFFSTIRKTSKIFVITEGTSFPYKNFLLGITVIGFFICFIWTSSSNTPLPPVILLFTFIALIIIGSLIAIIIFSLKKPELGVKFSIGIGGLSTGMGIIMLYTAPLVFSSKYFNPSFISYPMAIFFIVIGLFIIIIPLWSIKNSLFGQVDRHINALYELKYPSEKTIYEQSIGLSLNYIERLFVWFFWVLCFVGTLSTLYCTSSIISIICLGHSSPSFMNAVYNFVYLVESLSVIIFVGILPKDTIVLICDVFLLLYAGLFVFIFIYILWLRLKNALHDKALLKKKEVKNYDSIIQEMATYLKIKAPRIAVLPNHNINASAISLEIPFFPNYIAVYQGAIEKFENQPDYLYAMVAHEMGHLEKKDSLIHRLFSMLSQIALMGKNFLLILTDFYQQEYEADRKAIEWLSHHYGYSPEQSQEIMIKVLESTRGIARNESDKRSRWQKFIDLYFHGKPEAYFHPSIDRRIEELRKNRP